MSGIIQMDLLYWSVLVYNRISPSTWVVFAAHIICMISAFCVSLMHENHCIESGIKRKYKTQNPIGVKTNGPNTLKILPAVKMWWKAHQIVVYTRKNTHTSTHVYQCNCCDCDICLTICWGRICLSRACYTSHSMLQRVFYLMSYVSVMRIRKHTNVST